MDALLASPVALPLGAAGLAVLARRRPGARRVLALGVPAAVLAVAAVLLVQTSDGAVATRLGSFPAGIAIPLVADTFSALMLAVAALTTLSCTAFAVAARADTDPSFHPLVLVLTAGAYGAFLTADLFNLFVLVEVMLVPSYALLALGGTARRVRAAAVYVTISLLASTLLLSGVGLVYATAGTVNLGQLAGTARISPSVAVAAGVVALALAVKAAAVPVHGWLPFTYPAAPPAVTALFSGLLTKVGVYALYRVYAVMFDGDPSYRTMLLVVAAATMVVGVFGAVGQGHIRDILAFHMVSQIGYLLMGLALFSSLGLAAGIFYTVQYIVVKTALFLVAGAVEAGYGTGELDRLGGLARHRSLAAAFTAAALSLAGVPPLSGFVAKMLLLRSAFAEREYLIGAVAAAVGLLTLTSMIKIWNGAFWGRPVDGGEGARAPGPGAPDEPAATVVPGAGPAGPEGLIVAPAAVLAALTVLLGAGAEGLLTLADRAAAGLLDSGSYVHAVMVG